ncbi:TIGR03089 family protein [Rothia nasimurium]|uniref:TIGR03089 family protein n=1 Tax=Rothia nasimurium TaxID=85336 RepID=UPI001F423242|nr:TIGR03089 family protein [Rothia nasimurium]
MTASFSQVGSSFPQFMALLAQRQSPALLWYSAPGERIELSGRVFDNWVAKTANFLVDECEVEPDSLLALPQRLHWRSLVLAAAGLRVGATLAWGQQAGADVRAAFDTAELEGAEAEYLLAVAAEPLAPRFMGQLPPDVLDYAAEVRSHPDIYVGWAAPAAEGQAWEGTSYGQLMEQLTEQARALGAKHEPEVAALQVPGEHFDAAYLEQTLAVMASGRAALVLDPAVAWEQERLSRVLGDERARSLPSQR